MSRKNPYCIVPIERRQSRPRDLTSAVVFTTGLCVGIAVMVVLNVISVP